MATVTYSKNLGDYAALTDLYDSTSFGVESVSSTKIVFEDGNGAEMVLHGSHITKNGVKITGGKITSAEFYDADGDKIFTFTNVDDMSAKDIYTAYSQNYEPKRIMHGLMSGNDTVNGSKNGDYVWGFLGNDKLNGGNGDDSIYGHEGNDTLSGGNGDDYLFGGIGNDKLTGGKGEDLFDFETGIGKDKITDFDFSGSSHDYLYMDYYLYKSMSVSVDGDDLILKLSTGDQMTIENMDKHDLKQSLFEFI
jgi:Ca2+-binding RTX toxin-like protein